MSIGYPKDWSGLIFGMDTETSDDISAFFTISNVRPHAIAVIISPSKKMTRPEPVTWNLFIPLSLNETSLNAYSPAIELHNLSYVFSCSSTHARFSLINSGMGS